MHVRLFVQAPASHVRTYVDHVLSIPGREVHVHSPTQVMNGPARVTRPCNFVHLK